MNYNTLYKIGPKLDEVYNKLKKLDKYNFDYKKLSEEIKLFDSKLDSIKSESNNQMGAETLSKPDERLLDDLYSAINGFDKYVDTLLSSFGLFEHYTGYDLKLKNELNENELNDLVSSILNDLIGYKNLVDNGFKGNSETKDIINVIYKAIKKEFQLKGESTIYNTLVIYKLDNIINDSVKDDVNKYENDELIKARYIDYIHEIITEEKTKELLLLIAINDDNYKEKIIEKEKELSDKIQKQNSLISSNNKSIDTSKKIIDKAKKESKSYRKEILKTYISFLASIAVLIGGAKIAYNEGKPSTKTYFRIDKECYDTVDGSYDTSSYSETYDNDVVLKVYSQADESGERTVKTYALTEKYDDISQYLNIDLNEENLISERSINDAIVNSKSTDEYSSVEVIKNVNLENKVEKTGSIGFIILFEFITLVLWTILNSILNHFELGGAFYFFENDYASGEISLLNDKKNQIKNELKEMKIYIDKDEQLKKKLNELLVLDNELERKYKVFIDTIKDKEDKKLGLRM